MTPRSKSPAGSSAAFFQLIAVFAVFLLIAVDSDNRVYSRQAVLSNSVPQISDAEEEIESSKAPGFVNPVGLSKIKEIVKSEGIKLVGNKKKEWNKMVSRVLTFNLPTVEPIILTTTTTTTTPSPTTTTTKKPSKYCGYKAAAAGLTILGVASLFNFSSPLKEQVLKFLRNSSKSSTEDPLKNREKGGGSGGGLSIAYVITILVAVSVALVAVLVFFYSREGQEKSKNTTEDAEKEQQQQKKEEDNKSKEKSTKDLLPAKKGDQTSSITTSTFSDQHFPPSKTPRSSEVLKTSAVPKRKGLAAVRRNERIPSFLTPSSAASTTSLLASIPSTSKISSSALPLPSAKVKVKQQPKQRQSS
ncbi:hypothetical protein TYRP_009075 [Tyrophagus putrescentiae]|nr:hypothetical protein TYRP_009075 [Tyrophagus putrescentiae]